MPPGVVAPDSYCFDVTEDLTRLMETIVSALNAKPPRTQQLPAGLLEGETLVFSTRSKGWRAFDLFLEEGFPSSVQTIRDRLQGLGIHQLPMLEAGESQFRQVLLKRVLFECLAEQLVKTPVESYRMVPDVRRHIDSSIQVFRAL